MNSERPLDQVSSIKTKLAVLVAASVVITAILALIGDRAGVPVWVTVPVTLGFALAVTYWLARGMTAPLREMTEAASAMAGGDYTLTVSSTGTDEVGALARAFTTMARDLAATDQQRRELISTVSHELRTPLAAQRAVLENLVDGVTPPSEATLAVALTQTERLSDLVEDLLDLSRLESGSTPLDVTDIDLTHLAHDPVEVLLTAQLGGGTNIAQAMKHAESLVSQPTRTVVALISDFEEGGSVTALIASVRRLAASGVTLLGLAALSDEGEPWYDATTAARLVAAGMPVAAMTPDRFAEWLAEVMA